MDESWRVNESWRINENCAVDGSHKINESWTMNDSKMRMKVGEWMNVELVFDTSL